MSRTVEVKKVAPVVAEKTQYTRIRALGGKRVGFKLYNSYNGGKSIGIVVDQSSHVNPASVKKLSDPASRTGVQKISATDARDIAAALLEMADQAEGK